MALMGLFVYAESDYRIHFETSGIPGAVRVSAYQVFICAINLLSATPEAVFCAINECHRSQACLRMDMMRGLRGELALASKQGIISKVRQSLANRWLSERSSSGLVREMNYGGGKTWHRYR